MKKILLLALACLPFATLSQRTPKIKGNRVVTEVNESLPPFNAISLEHDLEVSLKKSFAEGYRIKADDNLVDVLRFEVVDSTLVISSFYKIVSKKTLEITVDYVELKSITTKAGKVISDDVLSADTLYLYGFGDSDLEVDADAFVVNITTEDNSNVALKLDADSLNIIQRHRSKVLIYSVGGATDIRLRDNGELTLEGTTGEMKVDMNGNARLKAEKYQGAVVALALDEYAVARIQATNTLSLNALGKTKTYLFGNPGITISAFADSTQLIKKELNEQ